MKYERFAIPSDLSEASLQEAALKVGPAFVYFLHVHPDNVYWVGSVCRRAILDADNPLSPYLSLTLEKDFARDEWCLEANGKAYGSEGVT